jgi:hypothetical protein
MTDYNAGEYLTSSYLKKEVLRTGGPQKLTIKAVENAKGIAKNGAPAKDILELVFTDDQRLGLQTQVNLKRLIEWFGHQTSAWVGRTIEAYYSPDVRGPGGQEGGTRLRLPDTPTSSGPVRDFTAALTNELPTKGGANDPF